MNDSQFVNVWMIFSRSWRLLLFASGVARIRVAEVDLLFVSELTVCQFSVSLFPRLDSNKRRFDVVPNGIPKGMLM
jgi:hypothetical protein